MFLACFTYSTINSRANFKRHSISNIYSTHRATYFDCNLTVVITHTIVNTHTHTLLTHRATKLAAEIGAYHVNFGIDSVVGDAKDLL